MVVVLVCGGGNAAHVVAGLAASRPDTEARVLTLYADEAERWTGLLNTGSYVITSKQDGKVYTAKPTKVSKNAADVAPGSDIIFFAVPAFAHDQYMHAIKDHLKPGVTIIGLPGMPGFEFAAHGIIGEKLKDCTLISFDTLPWACRITTFGRAVDILGIKIVVNGAIYGRDDGSQMAMLQNVIGERPVMKVQGHLLGLSLSNYDVHQGIMYGRWKNWDGKPLDEPPLFYQGVDEFTADIIDKLNREGVDLARKIEKLRPGVDLSIVKPTYDWYIEAYSDEITDKTSLMTCMRTNKAYDGLKHPMKQTKDGKYLPDFHYRYLAEDIPFALCVVRGVAEVVGLPTPNIDMVLMWAQEKLGKEYLVNGKMAGKDIKETRAPQKYGLNTLDEILG